MVMPSSRFAFVKANWHSDIVSAALDGFIETLPDATIDVFDVPGAFELPLICRDLARSGQNDAIAAAAFVVDGGIYRHDFVAQTVVSALMQVGLETDIPVLSVSLTPHQYQESDHHDRIFREHFVEKGREAARAAASIVETRRSLAAPLAASVTVESVPRGA